MTLLTYIVYLRRLWLTNKALVLFSTYLECFIVTNVVLKGTSAVGAS